MADPSRSLTASLLVTATILPGRRRQLRVVLTQRSRAGGREVLRGADDAASAAAIVRAWLQGLDHRYESGERSHGTREE